MLKVTGHGPRVKRPSFKVSGWTVVIMKRKILFQIQSENMVNGEEPPWHTGQTSKAAGETTVRHCCQRRMATKILIPGLEREFKGVAFPFSWCIFICLVIKPNII